MITCGDDESHGILTIRDAAEVIMADSPPTRKLAKTPQLQVGHIEN